MVEITKNRVCSDTDNIINRMYICEKLGSARANVIVGMFELEKMVDVLAFQKRVKSQLVEKIIAFRSIYVMENEWTIEKQLQDIGPIEDYVYEFKEDISTQDKFNKIIGDIIMNKLPRDRPGWKFLCTEKLPNGNPGIVAILDHMMGDGSSMLAACKLLCENTEEIPTIAQHRRKLTNSKGLWGLMDWKKYFYRTLSNIIDSQGPLDTETPFRARDDKIQSENFYMTSSKPFSLEKMKDIKNMAGCGCTVNDVLFTMVQLGVKKYLEKTNDPCLQESKQVYTFRCTADMRKKGSKIEDTFGNGSTSFPLRPDFSQNRVDTLRSVRNEMYFVKNSFELPIRLLLHKPFAKMDNETFIKEYTKAVRQATIYFSPVIVSSSQLSICGSPVKHFNFYVCSSITSFITFATYNGNITAGMFSDDTQSTKNGQLDTELFFECCHEELEQLHQDVSKATPKQLGHIKPYPPIYVYAFILSVLLSALTSFYFN